MNSSDHDAVDVKSDHLRPSLLPPRVCVKRFTSEAHVCQTFWSSAHPAAAPVRRCPSDVLGLLSRGAAGSEDFCKLNWLFFAVSPALLCCRRLIPLCVFGTEQHASYSSPSFMSPEVLVFFSAVSPPPTPTFSHCTAKHHEVLFYYYIFFFALWILYTMVVQVNSHIYSTDATDASRSAPHHNDTIFKMTRKQL